MPRSWGPEFNMKFTFEENGAQDDDLQDTLSDDISPHVGSDQSFESGIRLSFEELVGWGFGC